MQEKEVKVERVVNERLEALLKKYLNRNNKYCPMKSERRKKELDNRREIKVKKKLKRFTHTNCEAIRLFVEKIFCEKNLSAPSDIFKYLEPVRKVKNLVFSVLLEENSRIKIYDYSELKNFNRLCREYEIEYKTIDRNPEYIEIEAPRTFLMANNLI